MIHVVIVDDHQVVRTGLIALLENAPDIKVIDHFDDGRSFLDAYRRLPRIDVILLDIAMPQVGGLEVLKELSLHSEQMPAIIFLTVYSEEAYAIQAIKAGAKGYLTKDSTRETLIEAITSVAHGGMFLSGKVRNLMLEGASDGTQEESDPNPQDLLSPRELAVFIHICQGLTIKEMSYEMSLSPKTVSTYKTRLMEKLQISTLSELVKIGLAWGITK